MATEECSICYSNFAENDFLKLKCDHRFHIKCFFQYCFTTHYDIIKCPYCRTDIGFERPNHERAEEYDSEHNRDGFFLA